MWKKSWQRADIAAKPKHIRTPKVGRRASSGW